MGREYERIVPTLGHPKADDQERRLVRPRRGFEANTLPQTSFGHDPVNDYAIDVGTLRGDGGVNRRPIRKANRSLGVCTNHREWERIRGGSMGIRRSRRIPVLPTGRLLGIFQHRARPPENTVAL